jgi:hypothetical protein
LNPQKNDFTMTQIAVHKGHFKIIYQNITYIILHLNVAEGCYKQCSLFEQSRDSRHVRWQAKAMTCLREIQLI